MNGAFRPGSFAMAQDRRMTRISTARFAIGQIVRHREQAFRGLVIDVDAGAFDVRPMPGLPAVGTALEVHVDRPDRVRPVRIDEDLVIILSAAPAIAVVGRGTSATAALAPSTLRLIAGRWLSLGLLPTEENLCVHCGYRGDACPYAAPSPRI